MCILISWAICSLASACTASNRGAFLALVAAAIGRVYGRLAPSVRPCALAAK
jgi:hypothetical protein